jgi:DNA-binding HxlR family transcriptional regulator
MTSAIDRGPGVVLYWNHVPCAMRHGGIEDETVRRKSLEGSACAVARSLDVIGDWWSLLILRNVLAGIRRFSDLQKDLGVSKNILAARLRLLVAEGILEMSPASDGSAFQEYVATPKGRALMPVFIALSEWGKDHLFDDCERINMPIDGERRRPLGRLQIVAHDGRKLTMDDVVLTDQA